VGTRDLRAAHAQKPRMLDFGAVDFADVEGGGRSSAIT
jgi:hypothetical protein